MSEFVAEEYVDGNWPAPSPEDGVGAFDRPETAARDRAPAFKPTPRPRPSISPAEAEVELGAPPEPTGETPKARPGRRTAILAAGLAGASRSRRPATSTGTMPRISKSTDDAFIAARQFAVAAKASGFVAAVPVTDNQHVAAGDVIARIDDRDYRVALARPRRRSAAAKANVDNIDAQIDVQQAQIEPGQAQVESAAGRARLRRAAGGAL